MKRGFVFVGFLFLVILFLGSVSAACSWDETFCSENNQNVCWNICNTCWANICWDKERQCLPCPSGQVCSNGECVISCTNECSTIGQKNCWRNSIYTCAEVANGGCLQWGNPVTNCPNGCIEGTTTCSGPSCTDECSTPGKKNCWRNSIYTCVRATNGCLQWGNPVTSCPNGCTDGAITCSGPSCTNECSTIGQKNCWKNSVYTCVRATNGCLQWGNPVTSCPNGCTDGAITCSGSSCTPKTCNELGFNCGNPSDGCQGRLNCGSCGVGQVCSEGECKSSTQSCSSSIKCGFSCGTNKICDGNVGCVTPNAGDIGTACGCDNVCKSGLECDVCYNSPNICTWQCKSVSSTCTNECSIIGQKNCWRNSIYTCVRATNGCLQWGNPVTSCPNGCTDGAITCSGQSCTPKTCNESGFNCGNPSDGCQGRLNCGSCKVGQVCSDGKCKSSNQFCSSSIACGTSCGTNKICDGNIGCVTPKAGNSGTACGCDAVCGDGFKCDSCYKFPNTCTWQCKSAETLGKDDDFPTDCENGVCSGKEMTCFDKIDNDNNGRTDCQDLNCDSHICGINKICSNSQCVEIRPRVTSSSSQQEEICGDCAEVINCARQPCGENKKCKFTLKGLKWGWNCETTSREDCEKDGDEDEDGRSNCNDFLDCIGEKCADESICNIDKDCVLTTGETSCLEISLDEDRDGKLNCNDIEDCEGKRCGVGKICVGGLCKTTGVEKCDNYDALGRAIDDDGDGYANCNDRDNCEGEMCERGHVCENGLCIVTKTEICADKIDNDKDGRADCLDEEDCLGKRCGVGKKCDEAGSCVTAHENNCWINSGDEDGDDLENCMDPDCDGQTCTLLGAKCYQKQCVDCVLHENLVKRGCQEGAKGSKTDEDCDTFYDCDDPDCFSKNCGFMQRCINKKCCSIIPGLQTLLCKDSKEICGDGVDNDGDGSADCADLYDCGAGSKCRDGEEGILGICNDNHKCVQTIEICNNGLDDDANGLIDCADENCHEGEKCSIINGKCNRFSKCCNWLWCLEPTENCLNGKDDDGDDLEDCEDNDCDGKWCSLSGKSCFKGLCVK